MPIQIHYQPNTRPLLPLVVAPLPTFAAGLTNVGAPAVRLRFAGPDVVAQVRPTLATLPNLASELTKPGALAVRLTYALPTVDAPAKYNLFTAVVATIAAWTPTLGPVAVRLRYGISDFVNQILPTLAMLPKTVAGIAEPGRPAVDLNYLPCRFDTQFSPGVTTLPVLAPSEFGTRAQPQKFSPGDFVAAVRANIVPLAAPVLADPAPSAQPQRYALSDIVNQVAPTLALLPRLLYSLAEQALRAQPLDYDKGSFVFPDKVTTTGVATFLPGWLTTDGKLAVALRYLQSEAWVGQVQPTLATLPALLYGLIEVMRPANPPAFSQGAAYVAPDKFNITAPATTFLPGWLSTDGKLAVALKYLQADAWVGQIVPTLATLPTLLYGLAEVMRPANPATYMQPLVFTAPDKFNISVAAPAFLPAWLTTDGKLAVVVRYAVADFVNQVQATLATLPALISIADPGVNAQPQKYASGSVSAPEKVLSAPATISGWTPTPGLAAVLLRFAQPEAFVAQVRPTLATLPTLLAGIAEPAAPKVNLIYLQADAWISMQMNLPFIGGNPIVLLAGRTIPAIGVLAGKVVQAIGITTGVIVQTIGVTSGKILQAVGIKSGKVTT